ncbi:MAG: glycosidase [Caldithrix sp.]|nr:MAG: glycosidase [Caldithrix sp.]TDI95393.1 MAG: glycosidase [Caldithrix sp.]
MSHLQDPTGIFQRSEKNPILTANDWPYPANTVFNAGATRFEDCTLLLVRVEDMRGISHLTVATSKDGKTDWQIDPQPTLLPDPENYPEEIWGIEDPRITYLEELQQYAVTYTGYSKQGPLVSLATTTDFKNFKRFGAITHPENKDAALFPKKINDLWCLIHRPVYGGGQAHIWIAYSPDLVHWGQHKILIEARQGGWWDANKIGLNCPPIETPEGWLIIYHGVRKHASGSIYRIGLALLDLDDPTKVIRRSQQWVLGPKLPYERTGDVPDANFPCGAVMNDPTGELYLYYGAADTCMALATAKMKDILEFLKNDNS